jgi:stage V sporulation protein B
MKKEKFIISTIILIIGGFFTKILGMIIKIVITRLIGLQGIGLYMLILPTFNLFIILSQLGVPIAISKLVAENKKNNRKLIFSIIPIMMLLNIFFIFIIMLLTPILANYLLDNPKITYPLLSIAIVLPFITLSNIVRGYFFGKEKILPHVISNILEQVIRLIAIIIFVPILYKSGLEYAVSGVVLVNVFSELMSIIIFIIYLPKNFKINIDYFKPDKNDMKEVLSIGLPTTGGKITGSISYFLEPIILTQVLLMIGYSSNYIVREYGIISGYVLPLLTMPSFFSVAISSILVPVISRNYLRNNILYIKNKLKQAVLISFTIGLIATICLVINPLFFLKLIYNTNHGSIYLRVLAPFYLLYYIDSPMASTLLAIGKAKVTMLNILKSVIIKNILLFSTSLLNIGMYGLLIANIVGTITLCILDYRSIKKYL